MQLRPFRALALLIATGGALSCGESPSALRRMSPRASAADLNIIDDGAKLVISQVYGGGGNAGATLTNDFIEIYNPGSVAVPVNGWSVQYASSAGTTWQVTTLSGQVEPGQYYLVQESQGTGGTVALPTPDATGTIAMSATSGKVALVSSTTALSGTCPIDAVNTTVVDQVSFGTAASKCAARTNTTATLSNTTAALRRDGGFSGNLANDFATGAPTPRNSGSNVPPGPLDHVTITATTNAVMVGTTVQLTAKPQDANNKSISGATLAWTSSNPSVATVDDNGVVKGVVVSDVPVTISASTTVAGITKTGTFDITVKKAEVGFVDVSVRSTSFPAGFQTELFTTARVAQGGDSIPAVITFENVNPEIAIVRPGSPSSVIIGIAAPADGTTRPGFQITATAKDGGSVRTFVSHPVTIEAPAPAPLSIYAKNLEFGKPTSATTEKSEDLLIERAQYTVSYNESRGTPNWVSYELDARQMATGQDRCNCFTSDPNLPPEKQIDTSDYTNGGFDRGHMARSADRTAGNVDNATTYYLTNIVPQMADLNQGVWASFENALADSAKTSGRAVYIITGPLYTRGQALRYLKDEGKVAIPDGTWKVAFIGPRNGGVPFTLSSIQSWSDLVGTTVLAVNMPNISGIRNADWRDYLTTVDAIEDTTGYDFLSLLPVAFQGALEAGDHAPTARFTFSGTQSEGSPITFDASASTDPDFGDKKLPFAEGLTYRWHFSDNTDVTGNVVTHTFANNGNYTATLTVVDAKGWESPMSQSVTIANVAPVLAPLSGATLLVGEHYVASGSFMDPGADSWTAMVDYGDGSGAHELTVDNKAFELDHRYTRAGTFSLQVTVNDGDATDGAGATVVVESSLQGLAHLSDQIDALGAPGGPLGKGELNSLQVKIRNADKQLRDDKGDAARNMLEALVNELQAMMASGRLTRPAGEAIITYASRVASSIG